MPGEHSGGSGIGRFPYPTTHGHNMTPSEQGLSDLIHQRLEQHRDSILRRHQELCGDVVCNDTCGPDSWQLNASRLATELTNYAKLLEALATGLCPGPVVFPSWDERDGV